MVLEPQYYTNGYANRIVEPAKQEKEKNILGLLPFMADVYEHKQLKLCEKPRRPGNFQN